MALRAAAPRPWTAGAIVAFVLALLAASFGMASAAVAAPRGSVGSGTVATGPGEGATVASPVVATGPQARDVTLAAPNRTEADDPGQQQPLATAAAQALPAFLGAHWVTRSAASSTAASGVTPGLCSRAPPATDVQPA